MARIRTIKPDFWTDEKLTECSVSARLLFIGLLNFADDSGNLNRSAKKIKMQVFPADSFDCEPLICELIAQGVLTEYSVSGEKFLQIKGFIKHQVINRPTKSNIPPPETTQIREQSNTTHGGLTEDSLREGKGREGKGREIESLSIPREGPVDNSAQGRVIDVEEKQQPKTEPTVAGKICKALRAAGLPDVSPSHPELLALIAKGVTVDQFADAAKSAVGKNNPFAYMLSVVKGQLREANAIDAAPGMPGKVWNSDPQSVAEMAQKLNVKPWVEASSENAFRGEPYAVFLMRVTAAYEVKREVTA